MIMIKNKCWGVSNNQIKLNYSQPRLPLLSIFINNPKKTPSSIRSFRHLKKNHLTCTLRYRITSSPSSSVILSASIL